MKSLLKVPHSVLILLSLLLVTEQLTAQQRFTISGYIRDSTSNESVIGATISTGGQRRATSSNQYGFYSLTLVPGSYTLTVSHVGYQSREVSLQVEADRQLNIDLAPRVTSSQEVVIYAKRRDLNVRAAQMGKFELSMNQIKSVPAFAGEVDPLKVLQLLPGVRNAGEGNSGLYVRGGGPDQNLVLLDDAVVYNPGHLFGFFSVFNSDALKNVSLTKGGMPANYGGRISSVVDVAMKDGNNKQFQAEGGIGTISSRLSLQGPLVKEKASYMISARRTYIDVLVKPFINPASAFAGSGYYFYDLNTKLNYKFSDKDRLFLSGYFGRDVFTFNNKERSFSARIPWGNSTGTLRWNHVFNSKLFANTSLVWNDYRFSFGGAQSNFEVNFNSAIRDLTAKVDFDYYPASGHQVKYGLVFTRHRFNPQTTSGRSGDQVFEPQTVNNKFANEMAAYLLDDWEVNDKLKINYGLRYSFFEQTGPYTLYVKDDNGNKLDSTVFGRGDRVKTYGGLEPRVTMRYALDANTSLKAAVTRNLQFIHLVSNAGTTLPTDIWVPSTYRVAPQIGWQYAAGLFKNFRDNLWETSVELYYKTMANQIEYREGFTPGIGDPEESFVFGKGWSYGAEFYVNKARGAFTGWIGYTLSWTWRRFADLNDGEKYPGRFDRRHDLSVVGNYQRSKKWKYSAVFVYGTGNAFTLPERFFLVEGVLTQQFSRINQYRLPAYHRLDFSATYTPQPRRERRIKKEWVFSVYNAYSRQNPYFIYFDQQGNPLQGSLQVQARQVSLFPILPSVTLNFKL
ncbi:MAG TPA: TonB-dependent receptor [Lacibacter sp.]|nr:TonB-dependent receptor [Lacibacter sp.]HMO89582.1 TonB-dependent receptor [Lacibacter sp.]HMP86139.1 TonB-dependent receptor [Lacibacter sp.]